MNISKIDLIFFSVQKGFGLPAGLAVLIISPQAYEKAQHLKNRGFSIGSYHNFLNLKKYADKNQTYETPNVLDIFLLNKVVDEMNRTGIDKIRETILNNSNLIYDVAYEHNIYPHIRNVKYRSESVIVLEVQSPSKIIDRLKLKNLIIGKGYGDLKSKTIRIANFPAHTEENFEKLINKLSMLL
jgi:phosphoserine aminotransferase